MIQALIGPLASLVAQWFTNRAEVSKARHERKLNEIANDAQWETQAMANAMYSWKDEWWTVVLSLPIIALMFGVAFDNVMVITKVKEVFTIMSTLPEWYQYLLYIAVLASFGIKGVDKMMTFKQGN